MLGRGILFAPEPRGHVLVDVQRTVSATVVEGRLVHHRQAPGSAAASGAASTVLPAGEQDR